MLSYVLYNMVYCLAIFSVILDLINYHVYR